MDLRARKFCIDPRRQRPVKEAETSQGGRDQPRWQRPVKEAETGQGGRDQSTKIQEQEQEAYEKEMLEKQDAIR